MAFAGILTDHAQNAVNAFNNLNNGQGYFYSVAPDNGRYTLQTMAGHEQPDLGAYASSVSGPDFTKSFCVEPLVGTSPRQYGQLNYVNGTSTTKSGHSLTLGAAYLFSQFATGILDGYDYDSPEYYNGTDLTKAIQYLMGSVYNQSWIGNEFLAGLLDVNDDQSHWSQIYDPGEYYDEIGDYSIFVMNNRSDDGSDRQDFLFLTGYEKNPGSATPEPATMLIMGLGLAGFAVARRGRKKRDAR